MVPAPLIRRGLLAAVVLVVVLAAVWIVVAGPVTVYRTVVYNFSGIDDYRIFASRRLTASPQPFKFREAAAGDGGVPPVSFGSRREVALSELLPTTDTVAFLVVRDDRILYERYAEGFDRATPSMSFSMAKSILSILVGCAIADGHLKSVHQPVTDLIPELERAGFRAVTLKHLLQMTSGVDYAENDWPFGIHARFYYTDRLEREILGLRLSERPGSRFAYKSGDSYLLTLALKRSLGGKSITEYMQERIWSPLGMEADGLWSLDHAPDGLEKTGCCLTATARDFAKLGRLYLHKGRWQGRAIVPEAWVEASTRPSMSESSVWYYQQLWWIVAPHRPDFMANGHLGQFLYVNPAAGVIVVRVGRSLGGLSRDEWMELFMSLSDGIRRRYGDSPRV